MKEFAQLLATAIFGAFVLILALSFNKFSTLYYIDVESRACEKMEYLDISPDGKNWTCSKI